MFLLNTIMRCSDGDGGGVVKWVGGRPQAMLGVGTRRLQGVPPSILIVLDIQSEKMVFIVQTFHLTDIISYTFSHAKWIRRPT